MVRVLVYVLISCALLLSSCKSGRKIDDKYKDEDAVFLSLNKEFVLHEDGSQDYIYKQKLILQSHHSFNSMYGDSHILYDPSCQTVNILQSETENSMGKSIAGKNAINDVLPDNANNSRYFSRLRKKVVSHMGVERGAIINFNYKISSNKYFKPGLFENIVVNEESPIRELKIVIKIPLHKELNYSVLNSEVKPVIEEEGDYRRYLFEFKDVPSIVNEGGEPAYRDDLIRIVFSSCSTSDITGLINKNNTILDSVLLKDIVASVSKKMNRRDKLFSKLQELVVNNISLNNISLKQASYRLRNSTQIWNDASACNAEKVLLLNDLLRIAGYSSDVIVSVPKNVAFQDKINPDVWFDFYVSFLDGDNHLILRGDKLSCSNEKYNLEDYKLYKPFTKDEVFVSTDSSSISVKSDIKILSRKYIWGRSSVLLTGSFKPDIGKAAKTYLKGMMPFVSSYYERGGVNYFAMMDSVSCVNLLSKYFKYTLPVYKYGFDSFSLPILVSSRANVLNIPCALKEKYNYKVSYGKWYNPLIRDTIITKENSIGKVYIAIENVVDSVSYIKCNRVLEINKNNILPSEYNDFKKIIETWRDKRYRELYFKIR